VTKSIFAAVLLCTVGAACSHAKTPVIPAVRVVGDGRNLDSLAVRDANHIDFIAPSDHNLYELRSDKPNARLKAISVYGDTNTIVRAIGGGRTVFADNWNSRIDFWDGSRLRYSQLHGGSSKISDVREIGNTIWFTEADQGRIGYLDRDYAAHEIDLPDRGGGPNEIEGCAGGIWITETTSDAVVEFDPVAGRFTRIVPLADGSRPNALRADSAGRCWFTYNDGVGVLEANGQPRFFAHKGNFNEIDLGPDGSPWVPELEAGIIYPIGTNGFGRGVPLGSNAKDTEPTQVVTCGFQLCVADENGSFLWRVNPSTGAANRQTLEYTDADGEPGQVAAAPDGSMWVLERASDILDHVRPSGAQRSYDIETNGRPLGLCLADDGTVWITDFAKSTVMVFDSNVGKVTRSFDVSAYPGPDRIVEGPDGSMWFTSVLGNAVGRIDRETGRVSGMKVPTEDSQPHDIIADKAHGTLWFTESAGAKIGRISFTTSIFGAHVMNEFPLDSNVLPFDLALGRDGNLWFTEYAADRIARMSPYGVVDEYKLQANAGPAAIIATSEGIYALEQGVNQLAHVTYDGSLSEARLADENDATKTPYDLAADQAGRLLYVTFPLSYVINVYRY